MKKIHYIYCFIALLFVAGCTSEPLDFSGERTTIRSIDASLADLTATTRTHLENGTSVVWDNTDVLGVFSDTQHEVAAYAYSAAGKDGATFSGEEVAGSSFYAFYPYKNIAPDGTKITSTLAPEFRYTESSYTRQCPMVAKSTDQNFRFLQTCGIIKLSMTGTWKLSRITLKGNSDEVLAGTGTIDIASDSPLLVIPQNAADAATTLAMYADITLKKETPTDFYFIVPVQTFSQGLTFTVQGYTPGSNAESTVTKTTAKQISVSRAVIKGFTAIDTDNLLEEESAGDRETLMALYNALGGSGWNRNDNWGSDKALSQWYGVQVTGDDVTGLYLEQNNLSGTLPSETGNLAHLKKLYISSNSIEGALPASLGNLKGLVDIDFSNNKLSGDLPAGITSLPCWTTTGWSNVIQQKGFGFTFSTLKLSVPEFTTSDLMTSNYINSSSLMKEKELTLVYFWRSDYNYPVGTLKGLFQRYKDHGLNILALNADDNLNTARNSVADNGMEGWNHTNIYNVGIANWPFWIPTVALFDKKGELLFNSFYQDTDNDLPGLIKQRLGEGESLYESKDFSKDGTYETLQTASEGNGIDIVLMGDAYSDRLIADGTYATVMDKAYKAFFSEQPYTDFQHLFNVYYVNVVSANEEYLDGTGNTNTALSCKFGSGTYVEGNRNLCIEYAKRVPGVTNANIRNTLIIVMMNSNRYAGTCHMSYVSSWTTDFGEGTSVAYFPVGNSDEALASVLHHEAGGHGFGKLADEYFYYSDPDDPASQREKLRSLAKLGWYKNVDSTSDPTRVNWSKYIADPTYAPEKIGVYEGAFTFPKGFYRPTSTSIMLGNVGGFNAPSREMIYYRIHKLAYGVNWTFDYEKFKEWDRKNIREHTRGTRAVAKDFVPLAPPVVTIEGGILTERIIPVIRYI